MTALIAQPGDTFLGWLAIVTGAILLIRYMARRGDERVEAALCARLDNEAGDHNEPTRAQIEWEAQIAEAIAPTETDEAAEQAWAELPIYSATAAHIARYEAESIAAEWAELNGSGGAA